jgi:GTP-binding protein
VRKKLEKFSVIKALRSLERCDIALVMMDASEGVTDQDVTIASYALDRGRGCIILVNKWDLVEKNSATAKTYTDTVQERLPFLKFAPVLTVSALTGQRAFKIFDWVERVHEQFTTRVGTGRLNKALEAQVRKHQPPVHRGKRIRFYYATQVGSAPPTFICFVNYPEGIHASYKRYLINELRESLGLNLTPVRLFFRKREKR